MLQVDWVADVPGTVVMAGMVVPVRWLRAVDDVELCEEIELACPPCPGQPWSLEISRQNAIASRFDAKL